MNNWNNLKYQRIVGAKLVRGTVHVTFEDGDLVQLQVKSLVAGEVDNELCMLDFNANELIFSCNDKSLRVPWSRLRVLSDTSFGRYMAEKADEQSREVGEKLKGLRKRMGIKSNELADRAGLAPQTITRIEKGHTDVSFATLGRLLAAMGLTLKDLAEFEPEIQSQSISLRNLLKQISRAGLDQKFVLNRVLPLRINGLDMDEPLPPLLLKEAISYLKAVFNWSSELIFGNEELSVSEEAFKVAFYKKPGNSNIHQVKAYSHYANFIAGLVLQRTGILNQKEYPGDIEEFISLFNGGTIDFESCLAKVWDLGICVLPLRDKGVFHGASWNINGRHIIILKQTSGSHAKWLFDLLHELYHVFAHLDEQNTSVIETEEISHDASGSVLEEQEANSFAHQVLFGDRTESLVAAALSAAKNRIENLKDAVLSVSKRERLGADVFANYMAYRLSLQNDNWWGTANSLQITDPDPYEIAIRYLKLNLTNNLANPVEANLLNLAINN